MKESEKIWFILAVVFASIAVLLLVLTMPEAEVCHREIDPKTKKPGPEWCSTKTLFGLMTMSNSLKQDLQKKVETAAGNQWQNDTEDLLFLSRNGSFLLPSHHKIFKQNLMQYLVKIFQHKDLITNEKPSILYLFPG